MHVSHYSSHNEDTGFKMPPGWEFKTVFLCTPENFHMTTSGDFQNPLVVVCCRLQQVWFKFKMFSHIKTRLKLKSSWRLHTHTHTHVSWWSQGYPTPGLWTHPAGWATMRTWTWQETVLQGRRVPLVPTWGGQSRTPGENWGASQQQPQQAWQSTRNSSGGGEELVCSLRGSTQHSAAPRESPPGSCPVPLWRCSRWDLSSVVDSNKLYYWSEQEVLLF